MDHKKKLLAKAATDPKFLADLKKDPAGVIARETGVSGGAGASTKYWADRCNNSTPGSTQRECLF